MSSVLRSVRKRKKGRTLGAVDVIDREVCLPKTSYARFA